MKKSELFGLRKYVGDLSTVLGIKDHLFNDGPARGVRAFDVRNGKGMSLTVMADRGMDIPFLRYKGVNVGFASKTGVRASATALPGPAGARPKPSRMTRTTG